jgi:DNA modification methylase
MTHTLHLGDCRTVLATLDDASIDAIVCDPPYELNFMGRAWDNSGIAYDVTVWQQCLRVLKPGGHLVAFGGSRTYHRLAVAIEDAGFEIRDQIQWIYAQGFPKSLDVSKAMDKQAGAVREKRWKPITPHRTAGALEHRPWIDKAQRDGGIFVDNENPATDLAKQWQGWGSNLKPAHEPAVLARKPLCGTVADNVRTWGVGALNIDGTRIGGPGWYRKDEGIGDPGMWAKKGQQPYSDMHTAGRWPANVIFDEEAALLLGEPSRFFYIAKASKAEREAGLDAPIGERANRHPTIKPLALMRYLVRLVTPKGGKVLDPFMGSGSTGCAAVLEGFDFVGIDITPEYVAIAQKRIAHYAVETPLMSL